MLLSAVGWTLLVVGMCGVIGALFADRARGRRRCPRCRYDMAATPAVTCPECGRTAARERDLFTTKRHWGLAAFCLLLLAAGPFLILCGRGLQDGWPSVVPTRVLIWRMTDLDDWGSEWLNELEERVARPGTPDRHRVRLIERCIAVLADNRADASDRIYACGLIQESEHGLGLFMELYFQPGGTVDPVFRASTVHKDRLRNAILTALESEHPALRMRAVETLSMYTRLEPRADGAFDFARHAYPAAVALLADYSPQNQIRLTRSYNPSNRLQHYVNSIGEQPLAVIQVFSASNRQPLDPAIAGWARLGSERRLAVARLSEDVSHPDARVVVLALWGLLAVDADTDQAGRAIEAASVHPNRDIRSTAVSVARQLHERSRMELDLGLAERAAEDEDLIVRSEGLRALWVSDRLTGKGLEILLGSISTETNAHIRTRLSERLAPKITGRQADFDPAIYSRAMELIGAAQAGQPRD